jgi:hypothetical protein
MRRLEEAGVVDLRREDVPNVADRVPPASGLNDQNAAAAVDPVDESSKESFPASDAPAWQPLRSGPPTDLDRDHHDG